MSLSEKNKLDPNLWIDLLNSFTNSPAKFSLEYQDREERLAAVADFVSKDIYLQETMEATYILIEHFNQETNNSFRLQLTKCVILLPTCFASRDSFKKSRAEDTKLTFFVNL